MQESTYENCDFNRRKVEFINLINTRYGYNVPLNYPTPFQTGGKSIIPYRFYLSEFDLQNERELSYISFLDEIIIEIEDENYQFDDRIIERLVKIRKLSFQRNVTDEMIRKILSYGNHRFIREMSFNSCQNLTGSFILDSNLRNITLQFFDCPKFGSNFSQTYNYKMIESGIIDRIDFTTIDFDHVLDPIIQNFFNIRFRKRFNNIFRIYGNYSRF